MSQSIEPGGAAIPFALPALGIEEQQAVARVLQSGWLTTGPEAASFEAEFAAQAGARYAIALSSATAGLHLALDACGVESDTMVAMSPYTFTSTAAAACYLGATPLFVDIEPDSCNMDASLLADALRAQGHERPVRAIVPIHVGGAACAMESILAVARAFDCRVVEDAAHALPHIGDGAALGRLGDCAVYSFYATKPIACGEGGMVITDSTTMAERIRLLRSHGIDRDTWNRNSDRAPWRYAVVELGYKYNLSDLAAAIGRVQLRRAEELWQRRREIAMRYTRLLADCDFLDLPTEGRSHAWHLYIVGLRSERLAIQRDQFVGLLAEAGIGTSLHYIPLHCMPYYQKRFGLRPEDFPHAYARSERSFSLPIYPSLTKQQVVRIAETLRAIGHRARR